MKPISGVVPIVPTPFVPGSEEVDATALRRLVDFAVDAEAAAICLPAYGSEFYKLTEPERLEVVEVAVDQAAGRLPVMAQCNHGSATGPPRWPAAAATWERMSCPFALPRQFPLGDGDLFDYARAVCDAVTVPVLIQDWNPSGSSVGADFCAELAEACPNFRYIKLEEPRMGPKVRAIIEATDGRVEVFEGWGRALHAGARANRNRRDHARPRAHRPARPRVAPSRSRRSRTGARGLSTRSCPGWPSASPTWSSSTPSKSACSSPAASWNTPPCATPPSPSTPTPWPTRTFLIAQLVQSAPGYHE